jgi:branched-chain amino acid transport system ATP-binding protein
VSDPILQIRGLCGGYGSSQVLFDVDLDVPDTGAVAILGRNGAGKTTLLNTILGVLPARAGTVRVRGEDVTSRSTDEVVKRGVGYVPQDQPVFAGLTVRENLLIGRMGSPKRKGTDIERVLEVFPKLSQRLNQAAGTLSGGERKMVAISRALLGDPQVLLLDEPTEGVWIGVVEEIGDRLAKFAQEHSVVVVEQHLDFALRLADTAYVMERGKFVMESPAATIRDDQRLFRYLAP